MTQPDPVLEFATSAHWRKWLRSHHTSSTGVWLRLAKKGCANQTVSYPEALDEALCYGWIDGQRRAMDEEFWLQRFCPRRARSIWSKINCAKAEALLEAGRMQAAGIKAVEIAKENGLWDAAYAGQRTAAIPEDLQKALKENKAAAAFFKNLDSKNRYAILFRLGQAKKPETRERKLAQFVDMLARGETLHPLPNANYH